MLECLQRPYEIERASLHRQVREIRLHVLALAPVAEPFPNHARRDLEIDDLARHSYGTEELHGLSRSRPHVQDSQRQFIGKVPEALVISLVVCSADLVVRLV